MKSESVEELKIILHARLPYIMAKTKGRGEKSNVCMGKGGKEGRGELCPIKKETYTVMKQPTFY